MRKLVKIKFTSNSDLKNMLLETEEKELVEGNIWHDNTWGNCYCNRCKNVKGKNLLGKILMDIRDEMRD